MGIINFELWLLCGAREGNFDAFNTTYVLLTKIFISYPEISPDSYIQMPTLFAPGTNATIQQA